jgi:hypothetical protein
MFTTLQDADLKDENWTNIRMQAVVDAVPPQRWQEKFCGVCGKHHTRHDNRKCNMRYTEEL